MSFSLDQRVSFSVLPNFIHDFQREVIRVVTVFMPTDADLSKSERIASGISKPYFFAHFPI